MWTLIWILVAGAFMAFGFFVMRKVDRFLGHAASATSAATLRVGFSNPMIADTLSELLSRFSQEHPNVAVRLYSGNDERLLRGMDRETLDVVFLQEQTAVPQQNRWGCGILALAVPAEMKLEGLSMEPITPGPVRQKVLWNRDKQMLGKIFLDSLPPMAEEQWKNEKEVL